MEPQNQLVHSSQAVPRASANLLKRQIMSRPANPQTGARKILNLMSRTSFRSSRSSRPMKRHKGDLADSTPSRRDNSGNRREWQGSRSRSMNSPRQTVLAIEHGATPTSRENPAPNGVSGAGGKRWKQDLDDEGLPVPSRTLVSGRSRNRVENRTAAPLRQRGW